MQPTHCKAINKPRRIGGLDPSSIGIAILSASIFGYFGYIWTASIVAVVMCYLSVWVTKKDPNFLKLYLLYLQRPSFFDPGKRDRVIVHIETGDRP